MSNRSGQDIYQLPSNRTSLACTKGDLQLVRVWLRCLSAIKWAGGCVESGFHRALTANQGRVVLPPRLFVEITTGEYKVQGKSWAWHPVAVSPLFSLPCWPKASLHGGHCCVGPSLCGCQSETKIHIIFPHCPEVLKSPEGSRYERSPALCFSETHKLSGVSSVYLLNYWHF